MSDEKEKTVVEETQDVDEVEAENLAMNTASETDAIAAKAEIAIIDERTIRDKIYEVRGVKVMLDFELAEIYGYTTKRFNEQVKNNLAKFDADFRFQLTAEENKNLRSKKSTSSWGGTRYRPWAFTESGIYMLMTVLRGDLATKQSKALIRVFQAMKDYIVENQPLVSQRDYLRLSMQTTENTEAIRNVQAIMQEQQRLLMKHDDLLAGALEEISETVKRSEISPVLLQFKDPDAPQEYLLLNNEPAKAAETYMNIYAQAKKRVFIVDNYINIKTLRQLQSVRSGNYRDYFTGYENRNALANRSAFEKVS